MSKINYRELLEDADNQIGTYKSPNIDEFKEKFSELMEAAGIGTLMRDCVESISIYQDVVRIDTSWSARGCRCDGHYELAMSILDAEDPLKAAKVWGLQQKIDAAQSKVSEYRRQVEWYEKEVAKHTAELEQAQ